MVSIYRDKGSSQIKDAAQSQQKERKQMKWGRDLFTQNGDVWLQAEFTHLFNASFQ